MRRGWLYLSLALLSACTDALIVYERDAGDTDGDAGGVDAAMPDAGTDAGDPCRAPQNLRGIPDDCRLVRPPPRPLCAEDGDEPMTETAFLMPDFGAMVGYDLDGFCTTGLAAPTSCTNPQGGVTDTTVGGTDNSFGLIVVEGLRIADPSILASFERSIRDRGVGAPMIRLEGWNGLPDDAQVSVTFAVSASATVEPVDWESGEVELEPADGFFNASAMPLARDLDAYVTDGRVVATIPEALPFDFVAEGRRLRIALRDARIVGTITREAGLSEATVFGRWSVSDAIAALEQLAPCPEDAPLRAGAMNLLARAADTRGAREEDMAGLECNAISLAIRFTEPRPARWGAPTSISLTPMCM